VSVGVRLCTAATARCSDARDYRYEIRDCCRGHLFVMMERLISLCTKHGVNGWADYGTLLGAVRNPMTTWADYPWLTQTGRDTEGPAPGIVPHDKDADLGFLISDWTRVMRVRTEMMRKYHYDITANFTRGSMKIRVSWRNHTNIDLFFWHERKNQTMYRVGYAKVDEFKGREFPKTMLLPTSTVTWEGLTLPAPRDPEAFLEMRYGRHWRTPIMANNDGISRVSWLGKRNARG
jgi:hypothetical protein